MRFITSHGMVAPTESFQCLSARVFPPSNWGNWGSGEGLSLLSILQELGQAASEGELAGWEAKTHLGLGEVPDFLTPGGAEPAQARGLLDAVVQGGGTCGAGAHCLQVLAGEGLQGTWKTHPVWMLTHCLATRPQPLPWAVLRQRVVEGSKGPICHQTGRMGNVPVPTWADSEALLLGQTDEGLSVGSDEEEVPRR